MSLCSTYFVSSLILGFITCTSTVTLSSELNSCASKFHVSTECVPLKSCPVLRKQFEEGRHNAQIMKYFQRLICGFHADSPKICCPTSTLTLPLSNTHAKDTIRNNNSVVAISGNFKETLGNHKNFKLIPPLENCGLVPIADRIIGGSDAPFGAYPWLARIGYKVANINDIQFGCAGSIFSSRYLISAAHCFHGIGSQITPKEIRLSEYDVRTNPDCISSSECSYVRDVAIEKVIVHPDYNPITKLHDIALIRIREEISFQSHSIQPICLPFSEEYKIDSKFFENVTEMDVAGWGKTHWNSETRSPILQHVRLPVVPNKKCEVVYNLKARLPIKDTQMCAGVGENEEFSSRDTCNGDSGGASTITYHNRLSSKIFQIGIVSYGAVHCGSNDSPPGVYTKVNQYLKWILDSIEP